jgi:manganese-dependent inorganic pyrophosphatase
VLVGIVTVSDLAQRYFQELGMQNLANMRVRYRDIIRATDSQVLVSGEEGEFIKGNVRIAAGSLNTIKSVIKEHDIVLIGDRHDETIIDCVKQGISCLIVTGNGRVSADVIEEAEERNVFVLSTPYDTYTVARLINQCMPIDFFMKSTDLMTFGMNDYTDVIQDSMLKKRYRDFPILDKQGCYIGTISRRNLMGVHKRALILVDHNEVSQAVDNVENAEILEVIDHHRLGSLETVKPVFFRNEPVCCTATIIRQMFHEKGVEIPKNIAGLLLSAILSDTLVFRSPTCTILDQQAAKELAAIAKVNPEEHAKAMFTAGSTLRDKTPEEIFYNDFKTFDNNGLIIGIGQVTSMSQAELDEIALRMKPFLEKQYTEKGLDLAFFMLTNIIEEDTIMLCYGKSAGELIKNAFGVEVKENEAKMKTVVSRKKQVVPAIMDALNRDQDV